MKALVLAIGLVVALSGCSTLSGDDGNTKPTPAAASETESKAGSSAVGSYEEFEDVLIPREMSLDSEDSFVFENPQFKTGILVYEGRVDFVSLVNYFLKHMREDNWKLRSKIKYNNKAILVFEKPDRDCIINIQDKTFDTIAEVMVAPRLEPDRTTMGKSMEPQEEDLPR
jgi:hypothetical protein